MIDHAEFSIFARIQISTLLLPAYFARVPPVALETKIAGILIPAEFPDIAIKPPSSLSKTIAASNPAA